MEKLYQLLIDSSGSYCTLALCHDGELLHILQDEEERNHASSIHTMFTQLLEQSGKDVHQINSISVVAGPGSYTGLRIGLAMAKGLCFALDIPLILHNTLDLVAFAHMEKDQPFWVLQLARKGELFAGLYDGSKQLLSPRLLPIDEWRSMEEIHQVKRILLFNTPISEIGIPASSDYQFRLVEAIHIEKWVQHAYEFYEAKKFADLASAEPFYLKNVFIHPIKK